jgi:S-DNA-T family DNA segregation ATPase FtsK/SpoIIIE
MEKDFEKNRIEQKEYESDIGSILQTFRSFGIKVESIKETEGAAVTLYEVTPSVGTRISKIRNLNDEIAVALGVKSVRIIAPMENGTIGIEVPNRQRQIIPVADILQSKEFLQADMELPCAIGKTITDEVFVADLVDMPHLLVAGATGQGKSVGLNVLILSLLRKKTPDELKLMLIDVKRVEFSPYSRIENIYLVCPVITETDEAQRELEALCKLMDERYELLSSLGVRNIREYNALCIAEPMPYIVTVIDEYGDLILTSDTKMEKTICRITQKARAVGIHLIIATQRPDSKVVTGNIKANFPTRIAFRTTMGIDSRVVIDQRGAEKLSGRGDMLFFDGNGTKRMQCAYVDVEQVAAACEAISQKYAGYENKPVMKEPKPIEPVRVVRLTSELHIFTKIAALLVAEEQAVSEIWLKNKMNIGFIDARKIFSQLKQLDIIESVPYFTTGQRRRVLMHDKEEIERLIEQCEQIQP